MVKSGDVFEHPVTGEKIIVRKTARDTGGELYQMDFYLQSGAFVAAEHIHPLQEERFEVISGTLRGRVAGKEVSGAQKSNSSFLQVSPMSGGTQALTRRTCLWSSGPRSGHRASSRRSSVWPKTAR